MNSFQDSWQTYMQAWAELDATKQLNLLRQALGIKSTYVDPLTQERLEGYESIQSYIQQSQAMVPGLNLKLKNYYEHHDHSLAAWDMCNGEGKILSSGYSFARYDQDKKIIETLGFFA